MSAKSSADLTHDHLQKMKMTKLFLNGFKLLTSSGQIKSCRIRNFFDDYNYKRELIWSWISQKAIYITLNQTSISHVYIINMIPAFDILHIEIIQ